MYSIKASKQILINFLFLTFLFFFALFLIYTLILMSFILLVFIIQSLCLQLALFKPSFIINIIIDLDILLLVISLFPRIFFLWHIVKDVLGIFRRLIWDFVILFVSVIAQIGKLFLDICGLFYAFELFLVLKGVCVLAFLPSFFDYLFLRLYCRAL